MEDVIFCWGGGGILLGLFLVCDDEVDGVVDGFEVFDFVVGDGDVEFFFGVDDDCYY